MYNFCSNMDQSDENIDIVGDDNEMECKDEEDSIPQPQLMDDNDDDDHLPEGQLCTLPLTVQITPDSEPSGAKKRKPLKTTKLQVC